MRHATRRCDINLNAAARVVSAATGSSNTISSCPAKWSSCAFVKAAAAGILVVDIKDLKAKEAWLDVQNFGKEVLKYYGKI